MRVFDCDFHIHSRYSGGTSSSMELPSIARNAELKGLHLVGSSDALHRDWLKHLRTHLVDEHDGVYSVKGSRTRFMVTTEVEDIKRVHHLILLPSIDSAFDLRERLGKYCGDIDADGRPNLRLNGEELVDHVHSVGGLLGPSHAFTPWTAVYKEYNSLRECYGSNLKRVKFLELGLSADTVLADRISELKDLTFMTNSDCHSPLPHRLGREFNRLELKELGFSEIVKAIERRGQRRFTLNVGLNPREGKYHLTACSRCYLKFRIEDALQLKRRCPECRGSIKKGVFDRINELASTSKPVHPRYRPPYMHILPLAEVISLATGVSTLTSKTIQEEWDRLISEFGTEINVLVDADVNELKKVNPKVGSIIQKFRRDQIQYVAGGGGQYGKPTLKGEKDRFYGMGQQTLNQFT